MPAQASQFPNEIVPAPDRARSSSQEKVVLARDEDTGIGKADDVGVLVTGDVPKQPGNKVFAGPATRDAAELAVQRGDDGGRKMTIPGGKRHEDPTTGEADDVGVPIVVDIGEEARDLVLAGPAARMRAELAA